MTYIIIICYREFKYKQFRVEKRNEIEINNSSINRHMSVMYIEILEPILLIVMLHRKILQNMYISFILNKKFYNMAINILLINCDITHVMYNVGTKYSENYIIGIHIVLY